MKPEDSIQAAVVEWFRLKYRDKIIFSVPNGINTNIVRATRLKKTGLLKGVPDLCIPEPSGLYHGAYIEMKSKNGRVSPEQKEMLSMLSARGYYTDICYSLDEAVNSIQRYFNAR